MALRPPYFPDHGGHWWLPFWLHLESIGSDRKVPSARVHQTSAGPKILFPCGSGTMKNELCDLENRHTQSFLRYAKKKAKLTKQEHGYVHEKWRRRGKIGLIPGRCPLKNGGGDEISASYLVGVLKKLAGLLIFHTFSGLSHPNGFFLPLETRKLGTG